MAQNESIIDLFRYCARKDRVLSQALQGDFSDFTWETQPETEQEMDTTTEEPQPKLMGVKSQLKSEWLCNKNCWCPISKQHSMVWLGMDPVLSLNLLTGKVLELPICSMN